MHKKLKQIMAGGSLALGLLSGGYFYNMPGQALAQTSTPATTTTPTPGAGSNSLDNGFLIQVGQPELNPGFLVKPGVGPVDPKFYVKISAEIP